MTQQPKIEWIPVNYQPIDPDDDDFKEFYPDCQYVMTTPIPDREDFYLVIDNDGDIDVDEFDLDQGAFNNHSFDQLLFWAKPQITRVVDCEENEQPIDEDDDNQQITIDYFIRRIDQGVATIYIVDQSHVDVVCFDQNHENWLIDNVPFDNDRFIDSIKQNITGRTPHRCRPVYGVVRYQRID